jgi:hypothetical protein
LRTRAAGISCKSQGNYGDWYPDVHLGSKG